MEPMSAGDLVSVTNGGASTDGIVVDTLRGAKAVVALRDPVRGPVLRTVNRKSLTERAQAGPDDRALQLLIRRTPAHARAATRGGASSGTGRGGGYTRAAPHRATGK
jgi:hypothetical protein